MKRLISLAIVVLITSSAFAQGILFEKGTFQESLDKAKAENKLVFMDCYTSWCGPCKWLSKEVFPQKEVGDFFNKHFVNVKMDMEKGEGPALAKRYPEIKAYPTLLFLDADGKVLHVAVGGMEASALIEQAKKATDPDSRIDVVAKRYEDGDRSAELVSKYVEMLSLKMDEDQAKSIGKAYLADLNTEDLLIKENFKILTTVGLEYGSERHQYVVDNKDKFITLSDKQTVEQSLEKANYWYVVKVMRNKEATLEELDAAVKEFKSAFPGRQSQRMERMAYTSYYTEKQKYDEYFKVQDQFIAEDMKSDKAKAEKTIASALYDVALNKTFDNVEGANEWAIQKAHLMIKEFPKASVPYIALANVYKRMGKDAEVSKNTDLFLEKKKANGEDVNQRTLDFIKELKGE